MRRLTRSITVKAPSSFALAFLSTYFLERGPRTSSAELALRFPLPPFLVEGLTLEKRVSVHLQYTANGTGGPLAIGWEPLGSGPLPNFSGTLAASAQTETTCCVTIAGGYTPPGGIAGIVFDAVIGVRIANATLVALLERFGQSIEADYAVRMAL